MLAEPRASSRAVGITLPHRGLRRVYVPTARGTFYHTSGRDFRRGFWTDVEETYTTDAPTKPRHETLAACKGHGVRCCAACASDVAVAEVSTKVRSHDVPVHHNHFSISFGYNVCGYTLRI